MGIQGMLLGLTEECVRAEGSTADVHSEGGRDGSDAERG